MRAIVAFLEFLEGKHRIHVNPFQLYLIADNPLGVSHRGPLHSDRCGGLHMGPLFPFMWGHLGPGALLPSTPGLPSFPLQGGNLGSWVSNCCK